MTVPVFSCKLFHTLVAAAANVLSPKLLQVRFTASVRVSALSRTQFSGAYIGDQLTVVDKVAVGWWWDAGKGSGEGAVHKS